MGGGGNTTLVLKNNAFAQRTGNPHHGFMHFDNILWAFLVIFQVERPRKRPCTACTSHASRSLARSATQAISLEDWTEIMCAVVDA